MGKAFLNGGLLFSTITLVLIAAVSWWSFILLVDTKLVVSGSFGGNYHYFLKICLLLLNGSL